MKKLEVIVETLERRKVCRLLDELNVSGYTIIDNVSGKGSQLNKTALELSDVMKNSFFIIIEKEEVINKIINELKNQVFKFYPGKIFLSDVEIID